jgi:hypothetical protein
MTNYPNRGAGTFEIAATLKALHETRDEADTLYKAYFPTYEIARKAYFAMKIGDAEYMPARKHYDSLKDTWDKADIALRAFIDEHDLWDDGAETEAPDDGVDERQHGLGL